MNREVIAKVKGGAVQAINLSGGQLNEKYRDLKQNQAFDERQESIIEQRVSIVLTNALQIEVAQQSLNSLIQSNQLKQDKLLNQKQELIKIENHIEELNEYSKDNVTIFEEAKVRIIYVEIVSFQSYRS